MSTSVVHFRHAQHFQELRVVRYAADTGTVRIRIVIRTTQLASAEIQHFPVDSRITQIRDIGKIPTMFNPKREIEIRSRDRASDQIFHSRLLVVPHLFDRVNQAETYRLPHFVALHPHIFEQRMDILLRYGHLEFQTFPYAKCDDPVSPVDVQCIVAVVPVSGKCESAIYTGTFIFRRDVH